MPNQAQSGAAPRRLHLVDASPYIFRAFFSKRRTMRFAPCFSLRSTFTVNSEG